MWETSVGKLFMNRSTSLNHSFSGTVCGKLINTFRLCANVVGAVHIVVDPGAVLPLQIDVIKMFAEMAVRQIAHFTRPLVALETVKMVNG